MNNRSFYLYTRTPSGPIYVKYRNPLTGEIGSGRSTRTKNEEEAEYLAMKWKYEGFPDKSSGKTRSPNTHFDFERIMESLRMADLGTEEAKRILNLLKKRKLITGKEVLQDGPLLIEWLLKMWDYDKSPYVKKRKARRKRISRRRCYDMVTNINCHWKEYFEGKRLPEITRTMLDDFATHLSDKNLAPKTINNILSAGTTVIRWAYVNEIIKADPSQGLEKFSGSQEKRGILESEEVRTLFTEGVWKDERMRLANMVGWITGMRNGEVRALQVRDIGIDRINVIHNFSAFDGLKGTKNGHERGIPIPKEIRAELLKAAEGNPLGVTPESYIFFSMKNPTKPVDGSTVINHLSRALESIGISKEERLARFIDFHSWRHRYATLLSHKVGASTARVTGHLDQRMMEHYANHADEEDFQKIAKATREIYEEDMATLRIAG